VGHACVTGVELLHALEMRPVPNLSPAHAYWLARAQDGYQDEDGGAFIRSCVKALRKVGCCGETDWPLDRARINDRPSLAAEMSGIRFADLAYERVNANAEAVIDAIQLGHPVVIGMEVGNVFIDHMGDDTIPAPHTGEVMVGGHALLACGMDRSGERFRVANSWSRNWGDNGFAWMDSKWLDRSTSGDFWALVPKTAEAT
jgi:C1A family cysteine protease